jgi:hypothetical protein
MINLSKWWRKPAPAGPPKRVSTHLTPAYEARRVRELRNARAKFEGASA